ncbi:NUDIX domain-containing protein [bacterium]|jgi:bifunctional NMN adenylyltransferase/nudix hydrolase|nr:NUDIX domain-containing protein [bacterium]
MEEVRKKYDIGIIIGRFQIHDLHMEHKKLIDEVVSRHDKVILFLGCSSALSTKRNPMDFSTRKMMVEEIYSDKINAILPLYDQKSNDTWSTIVDNKIREIFPIGSVVLYGSKDSFIPFYKGKFATCELAPDNFISATDVRKDVSNKIIRSKEFRAGVIYSTYNRYPSVHSTIDVAICNDDYTKLLLGRKENETEFRFIGGFVDITDDNLEQTVRREAQEETGLEIGDIKYITSAKIDDWRYRNEPENCIMTHFHIAKKIFGSEKANDDIVELKWFDIDKIKETNVVENHIILLNKLKTFLNK